MIHFKDVYFGYRRGKDILQGVSFDLNENHITVLLGNNGSGKTTLLKCADGMFDVNSGSINKDNESIFITDNPYLYDYLTGREYLDVISLLSDKDLSEITNQLVNDLKLADELDKLILNYSLGMKHKLALITSIVLGYKLYLIDEPLTALDPESQRFIINYFKNLRDQGNTFLISTHMMHVAYELANEILILHNGKITKITNDFKDYYEFENYVLNSLKIGLKKV